MKSPLILLAASLIVASLRATPGNGLGDACRQEAATVVPEDWQDVGARIPCGKPITVLGASGGAHAFRPTCPEFRLITPQHGECLGELAPGMQCRLAEVLPVSLLRCECDRPILGNGWVASGCSCWFDSIAGTVESFETRPCEKPHD